MLQKIKKGISLLLCLCMLVQYVPLAASAADGDTGGDTTPAQITGVSITVDGVTYTEGDVTITPETESIVYTVTGTITT